MEKSWNTMEFYGKFWKSSGRLCKYVIYGHGMPWNVMEYHGTSWNFLEHSMIFSSVKL
jgi:hypothetical protein